MEKELDILKGTSREIAERRMRSAGYTYLAASYLRLFTKGTTDNFATIDEHLKNKFSNFYSFQFPLDEFHPELDTIKVIRQQFELDSTFRNTLYVILYSACSESKFKGVSF